MVLVKALVKMSFPQFSSVFFALSESSKHSEQGFPEIYFPGHFLHLLSQCIPRPVQRHNISKA